MEDHAELSRLLAGEKQSWDRFVARYAAVIYAAVHRRLIPAGRGEEADDVAQDVFLRLCARDFHLLRTYDSDKAKLSTWLTVISTSAAIDHLRRQKARPQDLDSLPEAALAVEPVLPTMLKIPTGLLSPRQALVLELLYRRDMDPAEAGDLMGVDAQTVRSTHHKALTKLRAHFREE